VLTFTVPITATPGPFTFRVAYNPGNQAGATITATANFTVEKISFPGLEGYGSDIHAGGEVCANPPSGPAGTGQISGNSNGASFGDFALSANGPIAGFGSDNSATANDLKLGKTGTYTDVCRPDLYAQAAPHSASMLPLPAGGSVDVSTLTGSAYYVPGDITLFSPSGTGTISHLSTIVASGTITIASNIVITTAGSYTVSTLPSLGLIAQGPIRINPNVTNVAAYMFSDNTIDTCYTVPYVPTPPTCNGVLNIDGMLMAHSIDFKRLSPLGSTGAQTTEAVHFSPQLYLNPPLYFDASADDTTLFDKGEGRPLF
jgi:hypothetical protein